MTGDTTDQCCHWGSTLYSGQVRGNARQLLPQAGIVDVPAHHADLYERALQTHKRVVKKVIIPGADHTFNHHVWESRVITETVDWLGETI